MRRINNNIEQLTTGGAWSSSNTTVATVDVAGMISGVTPGTSVITYTLPQVATPRLL